MEEGIKSEVPPVLVPPVLPGRKTGDPAASELASAPVRARCLLSLSKPGRKEATGWRVRVGLSGTYRLCEDIGGRRRGIRGKVEGRKWCANV